MTQILKVACVQMNAGPDFEKNLERVEQFICEAAGQGAALIVTPENTDYILSNAAEKVEKGRRPEEHVTVLRLADLAKELGVYILAGSISVKDTEDDRLALRSFLFNPEGEIQDTYDKMHLFDVDLPTGESYRESAHFIPGTRAVVSDIGPVKLGLSICYDMRFPHLFRDLAKAGAGILAIPSSFTVPTGRAHWHVLLRARAIETGCFVLAPAQTGEHAGGRKTYGHSLIISPWGDILAELEDGEGVIVADLSLDAIEKARQAIPALQHDREFDLIAR